MPTVVQRDNVRVTRLVPEGELTIYAAAEFKANLENALAASENIEIDLAGVSEMDTAGLQLLLAARREAQRCGKSLRLKDCSEAVHDVFELCGMTDCLREAEEKAAPEQGQGAKA